MKRGEALALRRLLVGGDPQRVHVVELRPELYSKAHGWTAGSWLLNAAIARQEGHSIAFDFPGSGYLVAIEGVSLRRARKCGWLVNRRCGWTTFRLDYPAPGQREREGR
jgi:hypothetical protein